MKFLLALPKELHKLIKVTAAETDTTITSYILVAIKEKLEKDGK